MAEETTEEAPITAVTAAQSEAVAPDAADLELVGRPAPEQTNKKKRSIRTRSLFIGALALGVVGGVAGGYTVQALREPTALPPLSVAQPVYPLSAVYDGTQPQALPASVDDATITNGDLTKLLLPTPPGARAGSIDHAWMSLIDEADLCSNPASCFSTNIIDDVARIADTAWTRADGTYIEIRITQYQPGNSNWPEKNLPTYTGEKKLTPPAGIPAAGYANTDSHGQKYDFVSAVHGDLSVDFWVTSDTSTPDPSIINDLITQQMARL